MKTIIKLTLGLLLFFSSACKAPKTNVISGHYNYDIVCVNKNLDGSIVVKTWGTGTDIENAVLNARRKAIDDLLFKGIKKGKCNIDPLISNPNKKQEYKSFFNKFYSKTGPFNDYISEPNKEWFKNLKKNKIKFSVNNSYELMTSINIIELKEYLLKNKII